jgi:hypothetical protein
MSKETLAAIIGIVILEAIALFKGIDRYALSTAIAVIAGLGGYQVGKRRYRNK